MNNVKLKTLAASMLGALLMSGATGAMAGPGATGAPFPCIA